MDKQKKQIIQVRFAKDPSLDGSNNFKKRMEHYEKLKYDINKKIEKSN